MKKTKQESYLVVRQGNFALWSAEEHRGRGAGGKDLLQLSPLHKCTSAYLHVAILAWYTTSEALTPLQAFLEI
ncbi:hypothetical protein QUB80_22500 [Chlorogloeopsis sp. ULAP01]|uniref:hypothetical protein n=1 Tax=Chlorogloeopsis sp. ULAP01 TaxID=3056483 RepID=UPI0025AB5007|nr:hypothetical protein [Chlorogloeopsis sp. ULAP01]MDM9383463.1 hypothetical protein [Chlorogloeopsis sp. ULAP01]